MTKEEKQAKLAEDYAEYRAESDRLEKQGIHIGTFSSWVFKTGRNAIKIAMTRDEHFKSK